MSRFLRFCLPVLMLFGLASCLKEKSVDTSEEGGVGSLRMKIDGKQWTANKVATASIANGTVLIAGISQDDINLVIQVATGVAGTFQLDQASAHVATVLDNTEASPVAYTTNQGANSSIAGGTVHITKIDDATKKISGTFELKVYRSTDDKTLMITEGVFENLTYTSQPPPTGTGNILNMKVDGVDFIPTNITAGIDNTTNTLILITAMAGVNSVGITVPKTIDVNTYVLDNTDVYTAFYTAGTTLFGAGPGGSLAITDHDKVNRILKGTFFFTGVDLNQGPPPAPAPKPNVAVTAGSFSVTY